jgi:photosystem II stability/assembly factor-like uncharacterized protein
MVIESFLRRGISQIQLVQRYVARIALRFAFVWCCGIIVGSPALAKDVYQDLFSVSFPTAQEGWACGRWGTMLHTSDGGKSWQEQESGTDYTLSSICFVDGKQGWAVGDGGTIIHTADGGNTWEAQDPPVIEAEAGMPWGSRIKNGSNQEEQRQDFRLRTFFMGVHFIDEKSGWIATERTRILHTDDGGKTWEVQFQDEDFILKSISFCDDRHGWAVGEFGYIYHTKDGGQSWEHQAGYFDISAETGEMVGGNYLFDVWAVDPETAWVAGIDGYVARTVDGGESWQVVKEGVPTVHLFAIARSGGGRVVAGGDAVLLSAKEGEGSFQESEAQPPITYGWVYDIAPRGVEGLVCVGKAGWIYMSDRQAGRWNKVEW